MLLFKSESFNYFSKAILHKILKSKFLFILKGENMMLFELRASRAKSSLFEHWFYAFLHDVNYHLSNQLMMANIFKTFSNFFKKRFLNVLSHLTDFPDEEYIS